MAQAGHAPIVVSGAGIAGLTASLALAAKGFEVAVLEKASSLSEAGAGLQISPNASRLLDRLGVLDELRPHAIRPACISIARARDLQPIARIPLGPWAEERWRAPYLVASRAALQQALLACARREAAISIRTDTEIVDFNDGSNHDGICVEFAGGRPGSLETPLLVAADGVWSTLRPRLGRQGTTRETGHVAWRRTIAPDSLREIFPTDEVTTLVAPNFHLVAYPIGPQRTNLVLIGRGRIGTHDWSVGAAGNTVARLLGRAHPRLAEVVGGEGRWTGWPIHVAASDCTCTDPRGVVLIGDAAHAMAPFAAQGAAMAIEDAVALATLLADSASTAGALERHEVLRRPRLGQVRRRGAFNHFAWHARGPVALARDLVLKARGPERLAADLDWLYGYDADAAARVSAGSG